MKYAAMQIKAIHSSEKGDFLYLIPSTLWKHYSSLNDDQAIRLGCYFEKHPIGVCFADKQDENARLSYIYVHILFRRDGVGKGLIQALENYLSQHGLEKLIATYRMDTLSGRGFDQFLDALSFEPPEFESLNLTCSYEELKKCDWFGRFSLNLSFEVLPWSSLAQDTIQKFQEKNWVPANLDPFASSDPFIDRDISMAILYKENLVGWVLCVSDESGDFHCPTAYIHPKFHKRCRILPVYTSAIERARQKGMQRCSFKIPKQFSDYVKFMKKRTVPHSEEAFELYTRKRHIV
ncbi:MAG: GNAT family N-acetyltransferase [Thermodesulfobacteriota bacterium]